jgi:hypothetical protein
LLAISIVHFRFVHLLEHQFQQEKTTTTKWEFSIISSDKQCKQQKKSVSWKSQFTFETDGGLYWLKLNFTFICDWLILSSTKENNK